MPTAKDVAKGKQWPREVAGSKYGPFTPEKMAPNIREDEVEESKLRRKTTGHSSQFFQVVKNDSAVKLSQGDGKARFQGQETPSRQKKGVSCIIAPPLSSQPFGLIQEELADDPFHLLVAVIFLNRTKGTAAIPLFRQIREVCPTPCDMAGADEEMLASLIRPLGLHNQRAKSLIHMAEMWDSHPPRKGLRYKTMQYPTVTFSKWRSIRKDEVLTDGDPREGAFEIGHLPHIGPYALDSWRIFCRDKLRGLANGWNGEGAASDFEPEWKRVLPQDKELRAFLRWMWLKEGFKFNPETGEKEVASEALMRRAQEGGLVWDANTLKL